LSKSQQITMNKLLNRKVNCVNKISGYKYIQIFQFIQQANKWKIHCKKQTEIKGNIRKKKLVILLALVLIFLTNHPSYNHSVMNERCVYRI